MSPEEFWEGDYSLVVAYRKAWELRQRKENHDMWLQGWYIYEALCDVSPVFHAFAKSGTKPHEYLREPVALTREEIAERKKRDEKKRYEDMRARITAWAAQTNIELIEQSGKEVREHE